MGIPLTDHTSIIDLAKSKGYSALYPEYDSQQSVEMELFIIRVWLRVKHKQDVEEPGLPIKDKAAWEALKANLTRIITEINTKPNGKS